MFKEEPLLLKIRVLHQSKWMLLEVEGFNNLF